MILDLIFLTALLFGVSIIIRQRQKFVRWHFLQAISAFFGSALFLYSTSLSIAHQNFWFLLPLGLFLLFYLIWRLEKRTVWIGILFNLFCLGFFFHIIYMRLITGHWVYIILLTLGFIILFLMIFFGYFGLVMFLLINAAIVRKRERPKLANRLGLLAGIGLLGFQLLQIVASYREIPRFIVEGARLIDLIALYFFGQFTIFLTSSLLYNLNCCKLDKKYIVVCGAGLKNGRTVTPLLRRRIIAALEFARRQEKLTGLMPMVIMSGGQGDDEQLSEAFAMKEAALNDGFPEDFLLLEECSTTTFGNLKCCDGIIRQREGKSVPVAFATNDYHLFRTGLSSRKLKMKAEGIPARTAPYFLPTAFLREFIAYLMSTKWVHVVLLTLMLIAYIYR